MFRAGERQSLDVLKARFADVPPPLSVDEARVEAARCLFCFDAPCTRACPTHIDVPRFIRQILHRDEIGAARTILEANIFGGSCARACPTEVLCEGACVDRAADEGAGPDRPPPAHSPATRRRRGAIGSSSQALPTGKRVAVVGSGPAGLCLRHELRRLGHDVVVFEARRPARRPRHAGHRRLQDLDRVRPLRNRDDPPDRHRHRARPSRDRRRSAGAARRRSTPSSWASAWGGPCRWGSRAKSSRASGRRSTSSSRPTRKPFTECKVGANVVVIGAGNTAIDVATAAKRLGAETVTIAYRRSEALIPAFAYEYELAKSDGVRFEWFAQPIRVVGDGGAAHGVEFLRTELEDPDSRSGRVKTLPGSNFVLPADMVVKALGQEPLARPGRPPCRT